MNIIRILNLYKQHYLKNYEIMAEKEYSCWGYFDCMSVELVENRQHRGLLMTRGNVNMTDLWYASANGTKDLSGHYGQQSIGMFRYEKEGETVVEDTDFWREGEEGIILVACMIQLIDNTTVKESMVEINQLISRQEYIDKNIQGITYRTFDNSDIILFLKGNSYVHIASLIDAVGELENIRYKYSVCGIAQKYLNKVNNNSSIEEIEYNGKKLINDSLDEVWLEIVSNGKVNLNKLSKDLEKDSEYAKVLGYMDNTIRIQNTDMWHVVRLFRDGNGGITHKNQEYGNGIYSISTVILHAWKKINQNNQFSYQYNTEKINSWCMKEIETLKLYESKLENSKNEVLYSNWLALIRVLNVLSQYENSMFSNDIFRIIFPSIRLMCCKFEGILKDYDPKKFMINGYYNVVIIEKYINEVDGIIQHLIHTSQTFLLVPGYSGSLYDIPTKLLLFYTAYAHKLIEVFSDSDQEHEQKFICFICPLLNHKPEVQEVETEGTEEVLLDIRLAQRHLYMPRAFLVILSHEIFHYIGNKSRCRRKRATHLIKMCVYAISYVLLSQDKLQKNISQLLIDKKRKEIQNYLIRIIPDIIEKRNDNMDEKKYMSSIIGPILIDSCNAVLGEPEYDFDVTVRHIYAHELAKTKDVKNDLLCLSSLWEMIETNRREMLAEGTINHVVNRFIYSFQEIYADISSIICLNLELKYYLEAIFISEGIMLGKEFDSIIVINRLAVVIYALQDYSGSCSFNSWKRQWHELVRDKKSPQKYMIYKIKMYIDYMTEKNHRIRKEQEENTGVGRQKENKREWPFFDLDGVWYEQVEYAKECIIELQKIIYNNKTIENIKDIRAVFSLFKMYKLNKDKSYNELFDIYDTLVANYNHAIDKKIKKYIMDIETH